MVSWASQLAQWLRNLPAVQKVQVLSLCQGRFPGGGMATRSSILAWKSHRQRSLNSYSPQGHKEADTTEATEHAGIVFLVIVWFISLVFSK